MPNLEITFSIEGDVEMLRQLQGVSRDLKSWDKEFKQVGSFLLKTFKQNFDTEGRTLGVPWQSLKPSTVAQKQRLGYPSNILVRTGRLKESFKAKAGSFSVVISNPTPYFVYHQSKAPRSKLPRRVMMRLDEKRKQEIVKIFQGSIQDTLSARGF